MRILFWNIMHGGGSRAGRIVEQILEWNPDIVTLAEFRGTAPSKSIAKSLYDEGFEHQLTTVNPDEPTWNALFLASRYELAAICVSSAPEPDLYWLLAQVRSEQSFHIGVVHAPWSIYLGRLEYYAALVQVTERWQLGPGVIIGDMNTGIDGHDNETENSEEYDETVISPLAAAGWHDPFRVLHPDVCAPTWYSPYGNGYRLDQTFVNDELEKSVAACEYDWGASSEDGDLSDHAALLLDLALAD